MTKKQHKEIARIWSATLIAQAGTDSFEGIEMDDALAIIKEVEILADKMLGNRPYILTLHRIIAYVTTGKVPD